MDTPPSRPGWYPAARDVDFRRDALIARYGSEDNVPLNEWDAEEYRRVQDRHDAKGQRGL